MNVFSIDFVNLLVWQFLYKNLIWGYKFPPKGVGCSPEQLTPFEFIIFFYALAEEQAKKKAKKNEDITNKGKENNNNKGKGKGKRKRKEKVQEKAKRRVLQESESDSNEDLEWYCIVCCDSYSNSLPREQWIECIMCKNWAHVKCINEAGITYVCPNCESEEELNDE